jgi:hypothetical protein
VCGGAPRRLTLYKNGDSYNTKTQNGYAILCFENPYWVCFLINKSVVTLLLIGLNMSLRQCNLLT